MRKPPSEFRQAIILWILLAAVSFLTGCGKSPIKELKDLDSNMRKMYGPQQDKDVTADPRYNFSSFAGTVWKTKVKTAVAESKRYTGAPETALLAPVRFDPTHPRYIPSDNTKIISVLSVGTVLRIGRLLKDQGAWGGVQVTATLEDGTNAQMTVFLDDWLLANNKYLNFGPTSSTNWSVDPEMLAPDLDSGQPTQSALKTGDLPQAGYEKGYERGKERAIEAPNYRYGHRFSDPWLGGGEQRLQAVKLYSEDYVAAYESGYNKGFQDFFQKKR